MSGPALLMPLRVGLFYFTLAALALKVTRFDGGVAMLWFATAYLVAEMSVVRRGNWPMQIAAATVASVLATGWFGFGWAAALPMAAANMLEAFVVAFMLRRQTSQTPLESLRWLGHFILAAAFVAPLLSGIVATAVAYSLGRPPGATMIHWIAAHGLGDLTFAPLFILFAQGEHWRSWRQLRERRIEAAALVALSVATTGICFVQQLPPLLFLPILPIVLVTFRLGRGASAVTILLLAVIGGSATLAGFGPLEYFSHHPGERAQFFQFYLATTVLTVWPIVAELRTRVRLHNALRTSEERYRLIADHSSDILLKLDRQGQITYVSPSIRNLGAFEPSWLIGRAGIELIPPQDQERVRMLYRRALAEPERAHCFDYEAITVDGSRRWFETHTRAVIADDGAAIGTMSIIRDVSERKANERSLNEAALTDSLTGLPNRRAFRQLVDARANLPDGPHGDCLAVLDLDHFKRVNDRYGHPAGDTVLRHFAALAQAAVREGDMVVRLGGEEFAILFLDTALDQAIHVCERLRVEVAATPTIIDHHRISLTVSGGVARIGSGGLAEALKIADAALYRAKNTGRDRVAIAA